MNLTHPALPDYTGPDHGLAGLVHHDRLYEYCWSFRERIAYIRANKPQHEIETRERCLVYLDPTGQPWAETHEKARVAYNTARAALDTARAALDTARAALDTALQPHAAAIEAQIQALVPDLPWDGTRLVFGETA